ncbi:MAG: PEP-CTERM sorting domain-containing protein [Phycisphaerae bacterium]|nr:PEP-CTERM sorting domain-containing protein [Phycisphaerae bacterium]
MAYFNVPGTYSVAFGGDRTTDSVFVEQGVVDFFAAGGTFTYDLADDITVSGGSLGIATGVQPMSLAAVDRLTVQNGGLLYIGSNGEVSNKIGYISYAFGWSDTVTVAGGTWTNSSILNMGLSGEGVLNITNGGRVSNATAYVARNPGSSGDITVDNGTWTNSSTLYLGHTGDTTMSIKNGGQVSNTVGYIGYNNSSTSSVTVNNGTWTNSSSLRVGHNGDGTLNISNGGQVSNTIAEIGRNANSVGLVTISGAASSWESSSDVRLGGSSSLAGGTGQLDVNGGTVDVLGTLKLWAGGTLNVSGGQVITDALDNSEGGVFSLTGGTVTVEGGALTDPGQLDVDGVGNPMLKFIDGATAAISNALRIGYNDAGQLNILSGSQVNSSYGTIAFQPAAVASATVNGAGSTWTTSGALHVGQYGDAELTVSGGGAVSNTVGSIADLNLSTSTATVTGADSMWTNSSDLYVGDEGRGTLNVTNGGEVTNADAYIAYQIDSSGGVTVDGGAWTSSSDLRIGNEGSGTLNIDGGGQVSNVHASIGYTTDGTGVATVDAGTWTNSGHLTVGVYGEGTLNINAGGQISDQIGFIGSAIASSGAVSVDGGTWTNQQYVHVGYYGSATLDILNAGVVTANEFHVGRNTGSTGLVTVGAASSLLIWNSAYLGGSHLVGGGSGQLDVNSGFVDVAGTLKLWATGTLNVAGGQVTTISLDNSEGGALGLTGGMLTINSGTLTDPGEVKVDGVAGATLELINGATGDIAGALRVGYNEVGQLNIMSGSQVDSGDAYIGSYSSSNGLVVVDDGQWDIDGLLHVGFSATGALNISNGGHVIADAGFISSSNTAVGSMTVSGAGSTWSSSGYLYVGSFGPGDLIISDGGVVSNTTGRIGHFGGSTGSATVDAGTWANTSQLVVGNSGQAVLDIANGGVVTNTLAVVGGRTQGDGAVTVSGSGSSWTCSGGLYIGGSDTDDGGTGVVTVNGGGLVDVAGVLKIWTDGTLNISGGSVIAGMLEDGGSTLNFTSGSLTVGGDVAVGSGELLGDNQIINSNKTLVVGQTTTIGSASTLALNGGAFSTGSLVNNGSFVFTSGTFSLTDDDLTIGTGGQLGDFVQLGLPQTVNVTNNVNIAASGVLSMDGGLLDGAVLNNSGLIYGEGRISAPLSNASGGEVRSATGDQLRLTGAGNTNAGRINIVGGTVEFTDTLINTSDGLITGQGTLIADGGTINAGTVALSGGVSHVYGDVDNQAAGLVVVSGGGTVSFWDDVDNQGEFRTSANTSATFFGTVSGSGVFTGTGTTYFEADLTPGSSPAALSFAGDVVFGPLANLKIEIGGAIRGDQYDALEVGGSLTLGGTLQVELINGFVPEVDDEFEILAWDSSGGGSFGSIELPVLAGRKAWDTSELYTDGLISVIGMLAGDTDIDWDVDDDDYNAMVAAFGAVGDWRTDFNEDGRVDLADFVLQRANFGVGVGGSAPNVEAIATPEPATIVLLGFGAFGLFRKRRNR